MASEAEQPSRTVNEHGTVHWKLPSGTLHRLDGPAVEYSDGTRSWWVNGRRHRLDGPAIVHASGDKAWFINGQRHRLDGPAIEYADGRKFWYVNGQELTEQQWTLEVCRRMRDA